MLTVTYEPGRKATASSCSAPRVEARLRPHAGTEDLSGVIEKNLRRRDSVRQSKLKQVNVNRGGRLEGRGGDEYSSPRKPPGKAKTENGGL